MSVILNISNRHVRILEGFGNEKKLTVTKCVKERIPESFMEQGLLLNEEKWVEWLKNIWEQHHFPKKNVRLVLTNRRIASKLIEAPELKEKEMYQFLAREYKDFESDKEQIYSYQKISPKTDEKMQKLLVAKIEQEELEKYQRICGKLGVKLEKIQAGHANLVRVLNNEPAIAGKTCIIEVAQGSNISNFLFLNGEYNYSSFTQIFEEHGTIGYAFDVARSVSEILQFMKANQLDDSEMTVYLDSFLEQDLENCVESIQQMNAELMVHRLIPMVKVLNQSEREIEDFLMVSYAICDLPKEMDFLQALVKQQKKNKKNSELLRYFHPVFVLTGVLGVITLVLGIMNIYLYLQWEEQNTYNSQAHVQEAVITYDMTYQEALKLQADAQNITDIQNNVNSYPTAKNEIEEILYQTASAYASITINSFDATSGEISINATAADVDKIHAFIEALNSLSIMNHVDYTGYRQLEDGMGWQVNLTCYLSGNAGKEGVE